MLVKQLRALGRSELAELSQLQYPSTVSLDTINVEVDALLKHVIDKDQAWLLSHADEELSKDVYNEFTRLIERRKFLEPVSYIIGNREFYGRSFIVKSGVLIPRPETELVVEIALKHFESKPQSFYLLDLCCGSGAILLSLACELKQTFGVDYLAQGALVGSDVSACALEIAKENSERFGFGKNVSFILSDLLSQVAIDDTMDVVVITANPPYVEDSAVLPQDIERYEPKIALRAGDDGLDIIRRIIFGIKHYIKKGAFLVMEIGENQAEEIEQILYKAGLNNFKFHKDLCQKTRVLEVER